MTFQSLTLLDIAPVATRHDVAVPSPALYLLSAGIGRTGCFIASSIGCQQLRETEQVDILETVCQLRLDRSVTALLLVSSMCLSRPNFSLVRTPPSSLQGWHDPNHRAVPVLVLHTGPVQLPASPQRGTHSLQINGQLKLQCSQNFVLLCLVPNALILVTADWIQQCNRERESLGAPLVTQSFLFPSTRRRNSQTLSAYSFRTFIWTPGTEHRTQRADWPGTINPEMSF